MRIDEAHTDSRRLRLNEAVSLPWFASGGTWAGLRHFRFSDWVIVAYFIQFFVWSAVRQVGPARLALAGSAPILVATLAMVEGRYSRPWTRVVRSIIVTAFVLVAYRQLDWIVDPPLDTLQRQWLRWDRLLLNDWGLHNAVEALGAFVPSILETAYALLYTLPPLAVGLVFWCGRGSQVDRFLATFFTGTFLAYALLPHFPTVSPRLAFPGQDLPALVTTARKINIFLLGHFDIGTSVFPSGHVAVGYSTAFGLANAMPDRRAWVGLAFTMATLVFMATIYGRYHYAVDGLASIAISLIAWRVGRRA